MRDQITKDAMGHIALFQNLSGAGIVDCLIDMEQGCVVYVVAEGHVGIAVGRGGKNIRTLESMTGKKCEIIEYADGPARFIENALKPAVVREVRITERPDGKPMAVVVVNPKDKGVAIGKNGRKAERARLLAKKYFQIPNVTIT